MIVRLWRTSIDPSRRAEYDAFVQQRSAPMFRILPGCLAAFFLTTGETVYALSVWEDRASAAEVAGSQLYRQTVNDLEGSGLLMGPAVLEVLDVHRGSFGFPAITQHR